MLRASAIFIEGAAKPGFIENLLKRFPALLSWYSGGRPHANTFGITFEPKFSTERYIKRNDRVSSFGACALNIANEIYFFGGEKNPFQISKLNGNSFQYLQTSLPIPVFYSLCTKPVDEVAIICGNPNYQD